MIDPTSNAAYCECGVRISVEQLNPRELEVMAFATERIVWGGSDDIIGDAKKTFGLTEAEVIVAWRNIAEASLRGSEACRHLR